MSKISAAQLRAARGLLGWSQGELAAASKVGRATIADFESGKREPYERTIADLRAALETAGVEFTNGGQPGVRWRNWKWSIEVFEDGRSHLAGLYPDFETTFAAAKQLIKDRKASEQPVVRVPAEATDEQRDAIKGLGLSPVWP